MSSLTQSNSITRLQSHLLQLSRFRWWLWFIFWIALIAPATALELRVAIKKNVRQLGVASSTTAIVRDSAGHKIGEIPPMGSLTAKSSAGNVAIANWRDPAGIREAARAAPLRDRQLWLEPKEDGYIWIGDRWYRGRTLLELNGNGIMAINYVDIEEYLYSVVGAEAIPTWPMEALKAQAVAARSYALYKQAKATKKPYDLDNTTTSQVYKGLDSEYDRTKAAVEQTAREVMTYNGNVILAVFHSSSGGHTENVEDIWNSSLPYLRGVVDYDQGAPVYSWSKTFSPWELSKRLPGVGRILSITPERTTPQGRIVTMLVEGDRAQKRFSGAQMRKALGLRSTRFTISPTRDGFRVEGRGFGHGVGLSQWGAHYLAQSGLNYYQILTHYYQNISLSQM